MKMIYENEMNTANKDNTVKFVQKSSDEIIENDINIYNSQQYLNIENVKV